MRRREFITSIAGAAIAWPLAARAQAAVHARHWVYERTLSGGFGDVLRAFYKGLKDEGGFTDGENVKVEYRWARGNYVICCRLWPAN